MENQHRKIKGYRELTQEEIDLMNEIKEMGEKLEQLTDKVDHYLTDQLNTAELNEDTSMADRVDRSYALNFAFDGKMSFKKGLMFLTRAIAQPESF